MDTSIIGLIIGNARKEQGATQVQLCRGLCDTATMSRIENGKQQPARNLMIALLERLGLSADRLWGMQSLTDLRQEELKQEIKSANAAFDYRLAISLLDKLEEEFDTDDNKILKQFVMWSRAINGRLVDGEVVAYPTETQREMMLSAIRYTVPRLNLTRPEDSLLALDEMIILVDIANTYSKEGRYRDAIEIYRPLLSYARGHLLAVSEDAHFIPLITYNYSRALGRENRHEECLEIAQLGLDSCIKYGKSRLLGELMVNKSCALEALGQSEEAKRLAVQAYYVLDAMGMELHTGLVKDYIEKTYQYKVD